jgi:hypothetical protein
VKTEKQTLVLLKKLPLEMLANIVLYLPNLEIALIYIVALQESVIKEIISNKKIISLYHKKDIIKLKDLTLSKQFLEEGIVALQKGKLTIIEFEKKYSMIKECANNFISKDKIEKRKKEGRLENKIYLVYKQVDISKILDKTTMVSLMCYKQYVHTLIHRKNLFEKICLAAFEISDFKFTSNGFSAYISQKQHPTKGFRIHHDGKNFKYVKLPEYCKSFDKKIRANFESSVIKILRLLYKAKLLSIDNFCDLFKAIITLVTPDEKFGYEIFNKKEHCQQGYFYITRKETINLIKKSLHHKDIGNYLKKQIRDNLLENENSIKLFEDKKVLPEGALKLIKLIKLLELTEDKVNIYLEDLLKNENNVKYLEKEKILPKGALKLIKLMKVVMSKNIVSLKFLLQYQNNVKFLEDKKPLSKDTSKLLELIKSMREKTDIQLNNYVEQIILPKNIEHIIPLDYYNNTIAWPFMVSGAWTLFKILEKNFQVCRLYSKQLIALHHIDPVNYNDPNSNQKKDLTTKLSKIGDYEVLKKLDFISISKVLQKYNHFFIAKLAEEDAYDQIKKEEKISFLIESTKNLVNYFKCLSDKKLLTSKNLMFTLKRIRIVNFIQNFIGGKDNLRIISTQEGIDFCCDYYDKVGEFKFSLNRNEPYSFDAFIKYFDVYKKLTEINLKGKNAKKLKNVFFYFIKSNHNDFAFDHIDYFYKIIKFLSEESLLSKIKIGKLNTIFLKNNSLGFLSAIYNCLDKFKQANELNADTVQLLCDNEIGIKIINCVMIIAKKSKISGFSTKLISRFITNKILNSGSNKKNYQLFNYGEILLDIFEAGLITTKFLEQWIQLEPNHFEKVNYAVSLLKEYTKANCTQKTELKLDQNNLDFIILLIYPPPEAVAWAMV